MYDNEIAFPKKHNTIKAHPGIYPIDRRQNSCVDLEMYTKGILQYGRHKAIILEYKSQLLGHIKMSGQKTFLWYGLAKPYRAWYVYDMLKWMEEWLQKSKDIRSIEFNDQWLAKVVLKKDDPLGLHFSRSINSEDYKSIVPEHLLTENVWWNIVRHSDSRNDNFHIDLQSFLEKIKISKLPIAHIPFKDIHYKKTLFYYLGLQKKLETY